MNRTMKLAWTLPLLVGALTLSTPAAADVVTDWDKKACTIFMEGKIPTPLACRCMAVTGTAIYEAVNAITKRYPPGASKVVAPPGASVEAAVAAANRATLVALVPSQQPAIEAAYSASMAAIADGPARVEGIAVGERAAAAVLAARAHDIARLDDAYRPNTAPGVYAPTATPVFSQWYRRTPWLMSRADQFRPGAPPRLTDKAWARDYNEIKAIGGKQGSTRTAEQIEIARFWETTGPVIYHGLVYSVAEAPGREITQNARLFAAVCQAMDDGIIAVFDAKYHYSFWRPITAIRNGDRDGNDDTERDSTWAPFIDTPMHPEYPCAHCISSGVLGTVLRAEIGSGPMPTLTTTSPTANGASRSWKSVDEFMQEVSNARIYDGVHFRTSTEVGTEMGKQVGALAVAKFYATPK